MYNTPNIGMSPRGLSGVDATIEVVWKRVNRNSDADCAVSNACYSREIVERVLDAYITAHTSGKMLFYYSPGMRDKVCPAVATLAEVPVNQVCAILNELYMATQVGELDSTEYLLPVTATPAVVHPAQAVPAEAPTPVPWKHKATLIAVGLVGAGLVTGVVLTKAIKKSR